jgi:hypothetical protein
MSNRPATLMLVLALLLMGFGFSLAAPHAAVADDTYHSQHIDLYPVAGSPLRSGFVENIHANGPQVYAVERYVLNGAAPNTTYTVVLNIYPDGSSCAGTPIIVLPTAEFTTNVSGNGTAQAKFTPADAAPLGAMPYNLRWELETEGTVAYETDCVTVTLD